VDPPEGTGRGRPEQQPDGSGVAVDVDAPILAIVEPLPRSRFARDADDFVTAAFEAHRDELFTFLFRTTRNDAEAEDLLQEAFIRLAREVRAGRVPEQLRPWLYRVASNLATSRFRRQSVAQRWLDRVSSEARKPQTTGSPEAEFVGRERFAEIERALGTLAEDARQALLLAAQGFSGREIAQTLGRSEVATRALMCRARMRVRTELEHEGFDRPGRSGHA
jgi:RNA polymerase sigma factor (sigma-70 family)